MHSFTHVPDTAGFVDLIPFPIWKSFTKVWNICIFDTFSIIYNIKAFSSISYKSYLYIFSFALVNWIF